MLVDDTLLCQAPMLAFQLNALHHCLLLWSSFATAFHFFRSSHQQHCFQSPYSLASHFTEECFCRMSNESEGLLEQTHQPEGGALRTDKDSVSTALQASSAVPSASLPLPIITIPILITTSDFVGALAAGKL